MYSKVYNISCNPGQGAAMLDYYDQHVAPAVSQSAHHVGHQMIGISEGRWFLISNYHSRQSAEDSVQMVKDLIAPMAEKFGMKLELIAAGDTIKEIS